MNFKKSVLFLLALVIGCALVGCNGEKQTENVTEIDGETFINPVANGADPFVFKDDDGTYYLYSTSGDSYGYRVYTSKNLVEWEAQGYCMRRGDVYTDDSVVNSSGNKTYYFWAPEVIREGDTYYMVYTVQEHIGIATSKSPLGPFTSTAADYLLPDFKNIDGHFFRDDDGSLYLYFVSVGNVSINGDSITHGNNIWGGPFDLETMTFESGYPRLLIEHDNKMTVYLGYPGLFYNGSAVAEGPEMIKHNGKYYLTFSQDSYKNTGYSVWYATSDSPMGTFVKHKSGPILITDDINRKDTQEPHLYGTGHHSFTTSPDGSELIIVYHAHRGATDPNGVGNSVSERRVCVDLAWFDDDGVLHAGRNRDGVPSATEQVLPSGGSLERKVHLDGSFAELVDLPTVYVANVDGNDKADGTRSAPFKTLDAAYAALPSGGTIVLTQNYNAANGDYYSAPEVDGPIMIKGEFSAVLFSFKFLSINSDTYFDNIAFVPSTVNYISVIECNFNNVVMGEGVSCIDQPTRTDFPYLVGGRWWTAKTDGVYKNFNYTSEQDLREDVENTITVLSGTWSLVSEKSVKDLSELPLSAPSSSLDIEDGAQMRN